MNMKLYCSLTSPYSRKVRVTLEELGLGDQVELVITNPFAPTAEFLSVNPLAKIPALVTERGEMLPDSALIVEYLMHKKPGLAALPRGARRWELLRRAQLAEGVIDSAVATTLEKRRPESIHFMQFLDRQREIIVRTLDILNQDAGHLALQTPGLGEITTGVALGYLDFRMPYLEWRKNRDALANWYSVFAQRPSMVQTQPPKE